MTHQCVDCLKRFDFVSKLRRHQLTHSGLRPFTCYVCLKSFRQSAHLKGHLRIHVKSSEVSVMVSQANDSQDLELSDGGHVGEESVCYERNESECELQSEQPNKQTHGKHPLTINGLMRDVVQDNYDGFELTQESFQNSHFSDCTKILPDSANTHSESSGEHLEAVYITEDKPNSFMDKQVKMSSRHQCSVCLKCFSVPSKLQRHLLTHSSLRPFCCHICSKAFRQLTHLKGHLSTHSTQTQNQAPAGGLRRPPDPIKTPWTEEAGDLEEELNRSDLHPEPEPEVRLKSSSPDEDRIKRNIGHECPVCHKCFSAPSKLRRHVLIHTGQRPFQCPLCWRAFRQYSHLKAHHSIHVHQSPPGAHGVSEIRFKHSLHMNLARKFRAAKHKLKISAALSSPSSAPGIMSHENITETGPIKSSPIQKINRRPDYSCSVCSKYFSAPSKLRRHVLIHTGQRPFRCSLCSRGFRQKSHLKIHQCKDGSGGTFQSSVSDVPQRDPESSRSNVSIRSGIKNPNDSCISSRASKSAPEARGHLTPPPHQAMSRPPDEESGNQCTICLKVFDFPSKLSRHLLVHMDIKPFKCNICSKKFRQLCHLQNHSRVHRARTNKSQIGTSITKTFSETSICTTESEELPVAQRPDPYSDDQKTEPINNSFPNSTNMEEFSSSFPVEDSSKQTQGLANQCIFCLKTFSFPSKLSRHLMVHTGDRPYRCHVCSKSFKQLSHLQNHQWVHSRNDNQNLKAGTVNHQGGSGEYTRSDEINLHPESSESLPVISQGHDGYTVHHQQWLSEPESVHCVSKIKCETERLDNAECKHFNRAYDLHPSFWNRVGQMVETEDPGPPDQAIARTNLHSLHFCIAEDSFQSSPNIPEAFKLESSPHHRDSRNVDGHNEHLAEAPTDMHICPSCSQCFDSLQSLDAHTCPAHRPEQRLLKPYQCAVCFKGFDAPSKLKRHYVIHTGQRPYRCNRCDKDYTQSEHLKKHMLSHS